MKNENLRIDQAVILAGGLGSRLGNITKKIPKPLIKVNGIPFIEYIIENFSRFGIKKILILTSYKSKHFFKKYHNKTLYGLKIRCHDEKKAKGTGGALLDAKKKLDNFFYLCNGDTFFNINILNFNLSLKKNDLLSIGVSKKKKNTRYSGLKLKKNKIVDFNSNNTRHVNSGYYLVNKKLFSLYNVKNKTFSFEKDLIPYLVAKKKVKFVLFKDKTFLDIGVKKDLIYSPKYLSKNKINKAVFLDRDGVINYDYGYVYKLKDFKWKPGVIRFIKYLNDNEYLVFVVSNQSGVGRGYYKEDDVKKLELYIQNNLIKYGAHIDEFKYSFYYKFSKKKKYTKSLNLRKPNIGNFQILNKKWNLNLKKSFMIGDQPSDISFGNRAGLKSLNINDYKNLFQIVTKKIIK